MYNIAICGSDTQYITFIKKLFNSLELCETDIIYHEYCVGNDFIHALSSLSSLDLLILDLQMVDVNSKIIVENFRIHFPRSLLIFYSDTFIADISLINASPFRYFLKKHARISILDHLESAIKELNSSRPTTYLICSHSNEHTRVDAKNIFYISKGRSCSIIHLNSNSSKSDNVLTINQHLAKLYSSLKEYGFEYAHCSYIVNLNHISKLTQSTIELMDKTILPISRSKKTQFIKALHKLEIDG